jgi:hypothetical protein
VPKNVQPLGVGGHQAVLDAVVHHLHIVARAVGADIRAAGLSVDLGGVVAFLPGSQVDLRPIRNLEKLIGETHRFKVIKFNKKRGNIVLSRKVLLEEENAEKKKQTLATLAEGKVLRGVVKNITDYGPSSTSAGSTACSTSPTCPGAASGIPPRSSRSANRCWSPAVR